MSENFKEISLLNSNSSYIFSGNPSNRIGTIENLENIEKISFDFSKNLAQILYSSKDFYEGQISPNFNREGLGFYRFSTGASYKGDFKANEFEGFGVFAYKNGEIYEGSFKSGLKHGFGRYIYSESLEFHGYFDQDLQSGPGVIKDKKNRSEFYGNWNHGFKEGLGIYSKDSGIFELVYIKNELKSLKKISKSS